MPQSYKSSHQNVPRKGYQTQRTLLTAVGVWSALTLAAVVMNINMVIVCIHSC